MSSRTPLHIDFKYRLNVRNKETLKLLRRSIHNARKHGLRILHYSFQSNHIHLIVEAESNAILTMGMRSLTITFAKGLKKGKVQLERYHLNVLRSIKETKHAIHYVLFNQQKHERGTYSEINEYSSVLFLENGLDMVRKFAMGSMTTLKIEKGNDWSCDPPTSYLASRALT